MQSHPKNHCATTPYRSLFNHTLQITVQPHLKTSLCNHTVQITMQSHRTNHCAIVPTHHCAIDPTHYCAITPYTSLCNHTLHITAITPYKSPGRIGPTCQPAQECLPIKSHEIFPAGLLEEKYPDEKYSANNFLFIKKKSKKIIDSN